ncbi:MAG: histone deacetylase [Bacteroidota bacterium]
MLKIAWSEIYAHPLPENHRFPMEKYDLLPMQLKHEGTISEENIFSPEPVEEKLILSTHKSSYWDKLNKLELTKSEIRKTGFPLSRQLVDREITIINGTVQASLFALEYGVAMNIAGGTHHAFTDRGEGFCLLNDIAIAANYLRMNGLAKKILVIDLDVHQGNGTAEIFRDEPNVFTFSMHGASNYPYQKEESNLDIGLENNIQDDDYLRILNRSLDETFKIFSPEFIFFQSGVDVLATDKLGKLGLTLQGCKQRDQIVLNLAKSMNLPLVASMGGGYSENINDIVEAHANTYRLAQDLFF